VLALLVVSCARPQRRPFPTLEEYSDGTSRLVAAVNAALYSRDRAALDRLCLPEVAIRPASKPAADPFVSPSGLRVERYVAGDDTLGKEAAKTHLIDRRNQFVGIVRNEAHLTGVEGRDQRRVLHVHRILTGRTEGELMQEESWWRWEVALSGRPSQVGDTAPTLGDPGWSVASMVEERRTLATASTPLFNIVYPEDVPETDWKASTKEAAEKSGLVRPGAHDTGGVAVIDDCYQGSACVLVGGGDGIAVLARAGEDASFVNHAALLKLDRSLGEAKGLLSADFSNDGIPDLLVTYDRAPWRLYRGVRLLEEAEQGLPRIEHLAFEEVTEGSGLTGLIGPYRSAVALDADNDGRLDLYVVQYGDSSRTGPSFGGRNGLPNRLFRNVTETGGPMRFEDVSHASGTDDTGWGLAAGAADYDGDGRVDLYVANDFGRDVLLHNVTRARGTIRFEDATGRAGTEDIGFGMGVAWGDYDLDGKLDLYVSNYWLDESWILTHRRFPLPPHRLRVADQMLKRALRRRVAGNSLFHNESGGSGRFASVSSRAGVFDGGWAWGATWIDADGDGLLDLAVANGMLVGKNGESHEIEFWNEISAGWQEFSRGDWKIDFDGDGITGAQHERLFLNLGDGTFAEVGYVAGFDTTADLRGLVAADVSGDGAPDLVGATFLDSPVVFQNTNSGRPQRVGVHLEGTASNWDAVGAVVRLTSGGRTQTRQVAAGGSYLSDPGRILDFGLGAEKEIDRVEVLWPSGQKTVLDHPEPRRGRIVITEPGIPAPGIPAMDSGQ
jgi:hypothetical protein